MLAELTTPATIESAHVAAIELPTTFPGALPRRGSATRLFLLSHAALKQQGLLALR